MKSTIVILALLFTSLISAQDYKVNGLILDGEFKNEPLTFVIVVVKETGNSVSTDIDGKYSLNLPSGRYTLVFDFVGYKSVEVSIVLTNEDLYLKNTLKRSRCFLINNLRYI